MKKLIVLLMMIHNLLASAQNCTGPGHSSHFADSWESCSQKQSPNSIRGVSNWVLFDLGDQYTLEESHFWNYNGLNETDKGIKDMTIDYSLDGINWIELDSFSLQEATGLNSYEGEQISFTEAFTCQYILITSLDTWGNSCAGLSEVKFNIEENVLKDVFLNSEGITLFPNPTDGLFTIMGNINLFDVEIIDSTGSVYQNLSGQSSPLTIDLSSLPNGLYFIRIVQHANPTVQLQKIIKQ